LLKEGWTEHAIADNLGVPETTLSRWLRSVFGKSRTLITPERQQLKEQAISLRKQGWTGGSIAAALGICPGTLGGWLVDTHFQGDKWNKGHHNEVNNALLDLTKQVIAATETKLTTRKLYGALVSRGAIAKNNKTFDCFCGLIYRERKCGHLDRNSFEDGRGGNQAQKYAVGTKVRIKGQNKNTPLWLLQDLRLSNCRTITAIAKGEDGHLRYFLGVNRKGESCLESHSFRADELALYIKNDSVGRPRSKRKYTKRSKDTPQCLTAFSLIVLCHQAFRA
jgi:AraC-like DNA-binding protein